MAAIVDETGHDVRMGQGRLPGRQAALAVDDPHHLGRPRALQEVATIPDDFGGKFYLAGDGAIRDAKTGYFTDHGPHRRRAERLGPPHGHDGNRIGAGRQPAGGRSRRGRPSRRPDRRGDLRLRRAQAGAARPARRPRRSPRNCATGSPRRSARSPSPRTSASATTCPRRVPARSCAGCCARSPRARRSPRTSRRWRTRRSWISSSRSTDRGRVALIAGGRRRVATPRGPTRGYPEPLRLRAASATFQPRPIAPTRCPRSLDRDPILAVLVAPDPAAARHSPAGLVGQGLVLVLTRGFGQPPKANVFYRLLEVVGSPASRLARLSRRSWSPTAICRWSRSRCSPSRTSG